MAKLYFRYGVMGSSTRARRKIGDLGPRGGR